MWFDCIAFVGTYISRGTKKIDFDNDTGLSLYRRFRMLYFLHKCRGLNQNALDPSSATRIADCGY